MSNDMVRVAVRLRIGVPFCQPHKCAHCHKDAAQFGRHSLSCRFSTVGYHGTMQLITSSCILWQLPIYHPGWNLQGFSASSNGKRLDGVFLVPWSQGRYLAWDVTCVNTFCPSNLPHSVDAPGGAAAIAEDGKNHKYAHAP